MDALMGQMADWMDTGWTEGLMYGRVDRWMLG